MGKTEVTIDSGAEESVCPESWGRGFGTVPVAAGKQMRLVNAGGGKIERWGSRRVVLGAAVF